MPTTWIISRHAGAIEWLERQGIQGQQCAHLAIKQVAAGDTVIGTLPVNLAADVCAVPAMYWHLSLEVPFAWRGQELTAEQMEACGVTLTAYQVQASPLGTGGEHEGGRV